MRFLALSFLLAATVASTPAPAGPNVPLCLAMQNNYNDCVRRQQARQHHWEEREWERPPWAHPHGRRHHQSVDCNVWILQLKANGCF